MTPAVPQASEPLHIPDSGMKAFQNPPPPQTHLSITCFYPVWLQPQRWHSTHLHSYLLSRLQIWGSTKGLLLALFPQCMHHAHLNPRISGLSRSEHKFLKVCLLNLCSPFFLQPTMVEKDGLSTSISSSFLLETLGLQLALIGEMSSVSYRANYH